MTTLIKKPTVFNILSYLSYIMIIRPKMHKLTNLIILGLNVLNLTKSKNKKDTYKIFKKVTLPLILGYEDAYIVIILYLQKKILKAFSYCIYMLNILNPPLGSSISPVVTIFTVQNLHCVRILTY